MKKNILMPLVALLLLLVGCNYNDRNFDGLDDMTRPSDVKKGEYTLTDADYATIASNATNKALAATNGVSAELAALSKTKIFSATLPAKDYLPAFAAAKWYTGSNNSAFKITYNKSVEAPAYLGKIAVAEKYVVSAADYKGLWGNTPADYFTPVKSVKSNMAKILGKSITGAVSGDYRMVSYRYSDKEPGGEASALVLGILDEDFTSVANNAVIEFDGWLNKDTKGVRTWLGKLYAGNTYAQVSSGSAGTSADSWLITPAFNLAASADPKLSFDVCSGYNLGARLSVLISTDYNGADPAAATWEDISLNFAIPVTPATGYGVLSPAGIMGLKKYQGTPFYLAFRFVAENPGKTGTYQIDNIQVGDVCTVVETVIKAEDFQGVTKGVAVALTDWTNTGDKPWLGNNYSTNFFAEATANNKGAVETSLISPPVAITAGAYLSFDVHPRYITENRLKVFISDNFTGDESAATWVDITDNFTIPTVQPADFVRAGAMSLSAYVGKTIAVKYYYKGDSGIMPALTTTYRIDNFKVYTLARTTSRATASATTRNYVGGVVDRNALYQYNGTAWTPVEKVSVLNPEDYTAMGITNFSSTVKPQLYLPTYLATKYPYALEDAVVAVAYNYNSTTALAVTEFTYTGGVWVMNNNITTDTEQFACVNGQWMYNPSVTLELLPIKNQPDVSAFFQAIVDYAATTYGDGYYQTGYKNAEYYYGASAYNNNFDFRPASWKSGCSIGPTAYAAYDVAAMLVLIEERITQAFIPALEATYPNADVLEGVDVNYFINFGVYEGSVISTPNRTITYKVVGKGKFEYVAGSYQKL